MKKILCFITTLLLAISMPMVVLAEGEYGQVVDNADLLSDSEEKALTEKIDKIVKEYNYDVVLLTNTSLDGASSQDYADDFFDYNNYGVGTNRDGMLFLFSTEYKDYWTSTRGYGLKAFTDYGIEYLHDQVTPILKDKEYYKAFDKYLDVVDDFLAEAQKGTPYDTNNKVKTLTDYLIYEGIALGVSLLLAIVVLFIMKLKMNTAIKATSAKEYVRQGSFVLNEKSDVYMYSNVTKVKIESNNSGGGSSSHTSSSGASHGGGGGRL